MAGKAIILPRLFAQFVKRPSGTILTPFPKGVGVRAHILDSAMAVQSIVVPRSKCGGVIEHVLRESAQALHRAMLAIAKILWEPPPKSRAEHRRTCRRPRRERQETGGDTAVSIVCFRQIFDPRCLMFDELT